MLMWKVARPGRRGARPHRPHTMRRRCSQHNLVRAGSRLRNTGCSNKTPQNIIGPSRRGQKQDRGRRPCGLSSLEEGKTPSYCGRAFGGHLRPNRGSYKLPGQSPGHSGCCAAPPHNFALSQGQPLAPASRCWEGGRLCPPAVEPRARPPWCAITKILPSTACGHRPGHMPFLQLRPRCFPWATCRVAGPPCLAAAKARMVPSLGFVDLGRGSLSICCPHAAVHRGLTAFQAACWFGPS